MFGVSQIELMPHMLFLEPEREPGQPGAHAYPLSHTFALPPASYIYLVVVGEEFCPCTEETYNGSVLTRIQNLSPGCAVPLVSERNLDIMGGEWRGLVFPWTRQNLCSLAQPLWFE